MLHRRCFDGVRGVASRVHLAEACASTPMVRWFSSHGCVCDVADHHEVWIGGTLVGQWTAEDLGTRNVLLIGLAQSGVITLVALAEAFDIVPETLRLIRRQYEQEGLRAIVERRLHRTGPVSKIDPKRRARMEAMFGAGKTIPEVFASVGKRWQISRSTVGDVRKKWADRRATAASAETPEAAPAETPKSIEAAPVLAQMRLPGFMVPANATRTALSNRGEHEHVDEIDTAPRSGRAVQHLGVWLLIAFVHQLGLYDHADDLRETSVGAVSLRLALDALIAAFAIGEHTAEGVRRLATPTASILLRARRAPSPVWVRATIGEFADDHAEIKMQRGGRLMLKMLERYLADDRAAREGGSYLVYIDNHLRPYTGKFTVRRGWRMQDKRVRPGISDYWLHDEDGRPLYRVAVPSHDSLVHWLVPMARRTQLAGPEEQAFLFAFDRAGAYPSAMSDLLEAGVEAVTYERKPYPLIENDEFFTDTVVVDKETLQIGETLITHRRAKLPLRRIVVRVAGKRQINLLSTSRLPARRLLEVMWGRWSQENAFKHGVERWGINQLDRRAIESVPKETIVPNPARRRLDHAIRLLTHEEGATRIALADDAVRPALRVRLQLKLADLVQRRCDLQAQRPQVPKRAPLENTELAGKLVQHLGEYKTVVDTVRVACANAESELAARIGPHLDRPAEAKKLLAALFSAPGRVRVGQRAISVDLAPAASRRERKAIAALLRDVSAMALTLPGDPRPLRFRAQT